MTTEGEDIAKLEERSAGHSDRIKKLEDNQRWGVIAILALVLQSLVAWMGKQ